MADTTPDFSNRNRMSARYVETNSKVWERLIVATETEKGVILIL